MTKEAAVSSGGRAGNRVPSKRYGKPPVIVVKMDDVPEPPPYRASIANDLYVQIGSLKPGTALRVDFESEKHADYVKGKLRKKAKEDNQFMSSARTGGGKTRFFWLEKL